jgi:hypothetical protein
MKTPLYQRVLEWVSYGVLGFVGLGSFLGAINDANVLITPLVSYAATLAAVLLIILIELILRKRKLPWISQGKSVTLIGLGIKPRLALIGAIALLWLPQLPEIATTLVYASQKDNGNYKFTIHLVNERYEKLYMDRYGEFFIIDPKNTSNESYLTKGTIRLSINRWDDSLSQRSFENLFPIPIASRDEYGPSSYVIAALIFYPKSRLEQLRSYLYAGDLN